MAAHWGVAHGLGGTRGTWEQVGEQVGGQGAAKGWLSWRRAGDDLSDMKGSAVYKLYVSPHPDHAQEALAATTAALLEAEGACFKIGNDLSGLLRPDKLVCYFRSREQMKDAAGLLHDLLDGMPAQGVPFTAELAGEGLLSWGVDPADIKQVKPIFGKPLLRTNGGQSIDGMAELLVQHGYLDQAADLESIVDKAGSRESLILTAVRHRRAIAAELRRSVRVAEFLGHRLARQQQMMRRLTQLFAGAEHSGKPLGSRERVATG